MMKEGSQGNNVLINHWRNESLITLWILRPLWRLTKFTIKARKNMLINLLNKRRLNNMNMIS